MKDAGYECTRQLGFQHAYACTHDPLFLPTTVLQVGQIVGADGQRTWRWAGQQDQGAKASHDQGEIEVMGQATAGRLTTGKATSDKQTTGRPKGLEEGQACKAG